MNAVRLNYKLKYTYIWHNPAIFKANRMEVCLLCHEDSRGNYLFDYFNFQDKKHHNSPYPILESGYLIGLN